jgi:hypothetical protein
VAGHVADQGPPQSLGWQSLCIPIPLDFELNNFLQKLGDDVTDEDLHKLKALLHGLFYFSVFSCQPKGSQTLYFDSTELGKDSNASENLRF